MGNKLTKYSNADFKSKLLKSAYVLIGSIFLRAFRIAGRQ